MNFSRQIARIKQSAPSHRIISVQKWRKLMKSCLSSLRNDHIYDYNLIDDLSSVVTVIPEEMLVEAALNVHPYLSKFQNKIKKQARKDNYKQNTSKNDKRLSESTCQSSHYSIGSEQAASDNFNANFISNLSQKQFRNIVSPRVSSAGCDRVEQTLILLTKETQLPKEFGAQHHPYHFLLKEFLFIIENKYSRTCKKKDYFKMEEVQQMLVKDVHCFREFISLSSQPYFNIYQSEDRDQKKLFKRKMISFIKEYVVKHEKINHLIRTIIQGFSRKSQLIRHLQLALPYFIEASEFKMEPFFVIENRYLLSINSLIEFAQQKTTQDSLLMLKQTRQLIITDIDNYYMNHPEHQRQSSRTMNAECQLEILKFILCKLKTFLPEIYAQLKYLEVVLGETEMSFLYDDSSYMYAQLLVAFQSLKIDYP